MLLGTKPWVSKLMGPLSDDVKKESSRYMLEIVYVCFGTSAKLRVGMCLCDVEDGQKTVLSTAPYDNAEE